MNVKLWAGVIVAMLVLTGTGLFFSSNTPNDDKIVIVSRVNEEGSGIFAKSGLDLVERDTDENFVDYNEENWGGLVFMSPGNQTIQHMMLKEIVEGMGLNFVDYTGSPPGNDSVAYVFIAPGNMKATFNGGVSGVTVDGGIVWESFFSDIVDTTGAVEVLRSGEIDPDHTCCVVAVNRTFAETSSYSVIRFLAAYTEIVDWINSAKDTTDPDYDINNESILVNIAKAYTGINNENTIRSALNEVIYIYDTNNLDADIAGLVDSFGRMGDVLSKSMQDIGFEDSTAFAEWMVDGQYLDQSRYVDPNNIQDWVTIRVTVLTGDIHGIAALVGMSAEAGAIFAKYKINVVINDVVNGPAAMDLLLSGNTDIGFIGAPPAVIKSINMYN